MGEMVAYRSMQALANLADTDKAAHMKVREPVEDLVSALRKIMTLLNNRGNDKEVVDRMETIRFAVSEVEDLLETWGVEVEAYMDKKNDRKRRVSRIVQRWHIKADEDRVMKDMMQFLAECMRERLDFVNLFVLDNFPEVVLERQRSVVIGERNLRWPRQMHGHGHAMEEHFVERKHDLEQLISLVTSRERQHKVVSIWGVEGLGKTSLAKKIYIHPQVRDWFKAFAWITLTQDYQMERLLQSILNQLGAGTVKMSAEEHKNGAGEKKKGAQVTHAGTFRQTSMIVSSAATRRSALLKKEGPEERRVGAEGADEEKAEGAEEGKKGGAEYFGFRKIMRRFMLKVGIMPQKKSEAESKENVDKKGGEEEQPKSSEKNMRDELQKILRQKKCFIIVDGVSEYPQWRKISSAFKVEYDTKILLTTDKEEIAEVGFAHALSRLKEEEGWELLQKYAFHGKKAPELGIVPTLGKEIVRKCEGLPSAISSIGRTLSRMSIDEWHKVNDDVQGYLQRNNQSQSNQITNQVSVPSYDDLSYCLKQCFLYLAMFKDADPDDLSLLWWAEGMLSSPDQNDKVIRELHLRDMLQLQVDELPINRSLKRVRLDNDAQELSLYKGEREGFLHLVDFSDGNQPSFVSFSMLERRTRRFVIHFNNLSSPQEHDLHAVIFLRSLFFLNFSQECVHLPLPISDFKEFALLRVLHFVRCKFEGRQLPQGIDKLFNLTYLGVLYCDLEGLPPSLRNVRNLHVLNVRAYDDARIKIPKAILEMVRLKHLRLPNSLDHQQSDKLKVKLDGLLDLETLFGFNADIHDVESLSKLENLRHLTTQASSNDALKSVIKFVESHGHRVRTNLLIDCKCDFTSEQGSTILEEVLMCPNLYTLTFSMVLIPKFPNCGALASKDVTEIKLIGSKLIADPMEALGKFPKLRKLCLGYGAFVGRKMNTGNAGFQELEYLEFRCLPNLEEWSVRKGAMKKLYTLVIRQCPKLKQIPQQLNNVASNKDSKIELAPHATTKASETDYRPNSALQIFSWNHILQALGCLSCILYLWLLTKRSTDH